jgi:antitoxin component YwqK of YwqJK toxin-antitoxin module
MIKLSVKFLLFFIVFTVVAGCQENKKEPENGNTEKTYYDSGKLESTTTIVNGKKNGVQKYYFENGKTASTANFVNDRIEGELKAYYSSGQLRISAHYKNGLVDGETRKYYPDGKIERIQKYDKGRLTYEKKFSEDGKVQYEDNY